MVLVDTTVWVGHLRRRDERLAGYLNAGRVLGHRFVIGAPALSRLAQRRALLDALSNLPQAIVATGAMEG